MTKFDKNGLYFVALGGAEEIGMNMYIYSYNGKFIAVDTGYGFLNDNYPGMDVCFADAGFFKEYADLFEAIFITHAHEDHFGAIAQIWPMLKCPVYASDFAVGLMKNRLKECRLNNIPLYSVNSNRKIELENFEVTFVSVVHSVPETSALVIKTKDTTVVHATDWRFDDGALEKTDWESLKSIGDSGVDMFVCDSTNIMVDKKQISESDVRQCLIKLIPTLKNTVSATCFASNLTRLESFILAADAAGRTPVLMGRSLLNNMKVAKELGYFQGLPNCYDIREASNIPADYALYICTGSQANYRSALTSIVNNQSKYVKLKKDDTVIFSSKIIPGNEEKIGEMQDKLITQGVNVITDKDGDVHTSGHANREDTKKMYDILKPGILLPVHGDKRFIREHKKFALAYGIKEVLSVNNGDVLLIQNKKAKIVAKIPTDVLAVDRTEIVSLNSEVVKRRKQIAYNGSVFISVIFGEKWELIGLKVSSKDILEPDAFSELRDRVVDEVSALIPKAVADLKYDEGKILDFVRLKVRYKIEKATEMKPVTFIHFYKFPIENNAVDDDSDNKLMQINYPSPDL
jgi:ribonuclease J